MANKEDMMQTRFETPKRPRTEMQVAFYAAAWAMPDYRFNRWSVTDMEIITTILDNAFRVR